MKNYEEGRLPLFVKELAEEYNFSAINALNKLKEKHPEITDHTRCANCSASMSIYEMTIDVLDCHLLLNMAEKVKNSIAQHSYCLNEANIVHIPSLKAHHSIKCRTSKARTLGLVAKVKDADGSQFKGMWCITRRGWDFLGGGAIPARVDVFRNKIIERVGGFKITMATVLVDQKDKGKYGDVTYDPIEWYTIAGTAECKLL